MENLFDSKINKLINYLHLYCILRLAHFFRQTFGLVSSSHISRQMYPQNKTKMETGKLRKKRLKKMPQVPAFRYMHNLTKNTNEET